MKTGRQMHRLQEMASLFSDDFKSYVSSQQGWSVSDSPADKSDWYKLNSGDGSAYYIRFDGPIQFTTAVDLLMKCFIHRVNAEA